MHPTLRGTVSHEENVPHRPKSHKRQALFNKEGLRVVTEVAGMQYNRPNTISKGRAAMAQTSSEPAQAPTNTPETEILYVVIQRDGRKVSAKWGLHPNLKEELKPEEWKELTEIMGKVTTLVGNRFSQVLNKAEEDAAGTA
jgi:hypothetical protein